MRVFLSWSGEKSNMLATALEEYLHHLEVETWKADTSLDAGAVWFGDILKELDRSDLCLSCITMENRHSGWIHFEAGRASQRVMLLHDLTPHELPMPLAQFQSVAFNLNGITRLTERIISLQRILPPARRRALSARLVAAHWPRLRDYAQDPLTQLFDVDKASKAPFLLSAASEVWRTSASEERKSAILELTKQIRDLRSEQHYLAEASDLIKKHSVWAICGKKTEGAWKSFFSANLWSKNKGGTIERVFLPPDDDDSSIILNVIQQHMEAGMKVYLIRSTMTALELYCQWNLPPGFGMTLMGMPSGSGRVAPTVKAVLVHWGGVGHHLSEHYGVILRNPLWTAHFWRVYSEIKGHTEQLRKKGLPALLQQWSHRGSNSDAR